MKTEVKVIKGEAIGSNLPVDPTKDGYTFKGWNTKADGMGEAVTAETVVTDEMEVYAVFEQNPAPIEEVKVVIDVDGVKSEVKVIKGEAIGSNLPADPTKEGYTFKGWNTKADGTGDPNPNPDTDHDSNQHQHNQKEQHNDRYHNTCIQNNHNSADSQNGENSRCHTTGIHRSRRRTLSARHADSPVWKKEKII